MSHSLAIAAMHFRMRVLMLLRMPAYALPTLVLPTLLFSFFGLPNGQYRDAANFYMTTYAIFAVLGVCFFQFGIGIATERVSPWERYLRTLPLTAVHRFLSQVLAAMVFATLSVTVVVTAALLFTHAGMSIGSWFRWIVTLMIGSIPFVFLGITIGYYVPAQAAAPIANLIYLPMAFLGGLFIAPTSLPDVVRRFSVVLPSTHFANLSWAVVQAKPWPLLSVAWLAWYTVIFALTAHRGYSRDVRARFR